MCFVLYAGTIKTLARNPWREDAPGVWVNSLSEHEMPVKAHFTRPEVQYIGSTSQCGCDFPHVTLQNGHWPMFSVLNAQGDESERVNREGLVDVLRSSGEDSIELYGVWDGDVGEIPKARETILLNRILDPDFFFKEQGFYTVQIGG
jgi:hypothetical protein